jgi:hypothetical protein
MNTEDKELMAMASISSALAELDDVAKQRVIAWISSRLGIKSAPAIEGERPALQAPAADSWGDGAMDSLPDFFDAIDPQTDMERAITVAAYLQIQGGKEELTSQEIHAELKNLGYASSNITVAITRASEVSPRLMFQTHKDGATKQGRKKYKVTREGIKYLQAKAAGKKQEPKS